MSYAVCSVLAQTAEPLTYRELAQQARWYLQGMPQPWYKGPVLEGTAIDREVLGAQEKLGRSSISLERINAGQLRVDVGYLHGLTIGSVLSVYPPTGSDNSQELSGYVRVTAVQPWEATVVPYAYGDKEARSPEELPTPGNCRVEYIDYGALRLRVAVAGLSNDSNRLNLADRTLHGEHQAALVKIVEGMASAENSLVELVDTPEQAHWWLLVDERGVYLRQAGDEADEAARNAHLFGPYALDGTEELEEALLRVAKVVNLRQLAAASDTVVTRSAAAEVVASIGQRNLASGEITPVSKFTPLRWRNGDQAVVTLTNRGRLPVDVTVLYIDSAFGIALLTSLRRTRQSALSRRRREATRRSLRHQRQHTWLRGRDRDHAGHRSDASKRVRLVRGHCAATVDSHSRRGRHATTTTDGSCCVRRNTRRRCPTAGELLDSTAEMGSDSLERTFQFSRLIAGRAKPPLATGSTTRK